MKYNFTKMHGCGNDYVYFNCLLDSIEDPASLAVRVADRHKGVGGDGIVLICPSDVADAKMRMFNMDGSEGKMCGNAIRCVGKYLYDEGIVCKDTVSIETLSGVKTIELNIAEGKAIGACVDMGTPELLSHLIPVSLPLEKVINHSIVIQDQEYSITCVSMGNPHCVLFVDDVDHFDVAGVGTKINECGIFPQRVNVEFVQIIDSATLKMRVWERGSGETLACGTGACASVVGAYLNGYCQKDKDIKVILLGGELIIKYSHESVFMTGEAVNVFSGSFCAINN